METDERILYVLKQTRILKWPRQFLSTFGSSIIKYFILSEPIYTEFEKGSRETVIREGEITWGQPKIITSSYFLKREGFSEEAERALDMLTMENPDLAGFLYPLKMKIEPERMSIVSGNWKEVYKKLKEEVAQNKDERFTIIKGVDLLWDVSLMKFVLEMTLKSVHLSHLPEWSRRGYIRIDKKGLPLVIKDNSGIPVFIRKDIEKMFGLVKGGKLGLFELKEELDRWGVFEEYEERFFNLFRDGRR